MHRSSRRLATTSARTLDAGGTLHTGGYNEQVGEVPGDDVQVRLNANDWFDDDAGVNPADFTTPSGHRRRAVCSQDAGRQGDRGELLPARQHHSALPRPEAQGACRDPGERRDLRSGTPPPGRACSEAAQRRCRLRRRDARRELRADSLGRVLQRRVRDRRPTRTASPECRRGSTTGRPTTDPRAAIARPSTSMPSKVGVVVALSHRPKCPAPARASTSTTRCPPHTIDEFCNQGTTAIAQCYYTTGTSTQTFHSGLQFIRGWSAPPRDPQPDLLSTWIEPPIGGNFCYQGYFSAPVANDCTVTLRANVDPGFGGVGNYEIRYKLVSGNTSVAGRRRPGSLQRQLRRQLRAWRRRHGERHQLEPSVRTSRRRASRSTATTSRPR